MTKLRTATIAIICALGVLSRVSETYAAGAVDTTDVPKSIPGRAQLEKDPKKYNLDKIHWIGMANAEDTNTPVLGLAEAMWKGSPVFLKCGTDLSREILAFKMLEVAKSAPNVKDNRDTIMTPLEYFQISRGFLSKNVDCFIYEFVFGMKLEDFVKSQKVVEIAKDLPAILMDIVKGLDYLYRTNLAHNDLHGGNFMVYRDRTTQRPRVKIIDYDRALPLVGDKELATKTGKFVALTESTKLKSDGCRSNNESVYNLLRQLLFNSAGFMDDEQTKYLQKKLQSQGASAQETSDSIKRLNDVLSVGLKLFKTTENSCLLPGQLLKAWALK